MCGFYWATLYIVMARMLSAIKSVTKQQHDDVVVVV